MPVKYFTKNKYPQKLQNIKGTTGKFNTFKIFDETFKNNNKNT